MQISQLEAYHCIQLRFFTIRDYDKLLHTGSFKDMHGDGARYQSANGSSDHSHTGRSSQRVQQIAKITRLRPGPHCYASTFTRQKHKRRSQENEREQKWEADAICNYAGIIPWSLCPLQTPGPYDTIDV